MFPVSFASRTKMWADPRVVESQALDQVRHIDALPWVYGVRVMPDVHFGKGATVGSVIAMPDAVCPAAVGVDIGCLDGDTEYLSPLGWVKISEYPAFNSEVLQFNLETNSASFVAPVAYIAEEYEWMFHITHTEGLDQMVTHDHKVPYYRGTRGRGFTPLVQDAKSFIDHHESLSKGITGGFKTAFSLDGSKRYCNYSDDEIRLRIMVSADGSIRTRKTIGFKAEVHLRKQRKIERCTEILQRLSMEFSKYDHSDGSTTFVFDAPFEGKNLTFLFQCNSDQLRVASEEAIFWDGSTTTIDGTTRRYFSSSNKTSADAIQFAFNATGVRAGIYESKYTTSDGSVVPCWYVIPTKNPFVGMKPGKVNKVPAPGGMAYCFTVPSGFFVARRNNNIFITGNCGVGVVKTNLTSNDLPDNLAGLRSAIEQAVPVGFSGHQEPVEVSSMHGVKSAPYRALWGAYRAVDGAPQDDSKARLQLGTLGGGNHFIEVCLDEHDTVWVMLHSGSRNVGKTIAEYHIGQAKTLEHNAALPDKDLAVFVAGSPELDAYAHDVKWAQDYALLNRDLMLHLVMDVIRGQFPTAAFGEKVLCHHNYISRENIDGQDMFVTRKGAISARAGEMGVIPGSMGTRSYVVRGLGNMDSFCSASHGAGRRMSRGEAKRRFTLADLEAQTAGIECRKDSAVIDEIPSAYKNIDDVIAAQTELVEVRAVLRQVLCVKG